MSPSHSVTFLETASRWKTLTDKFSPSFVHWPLCSDKAKCWLHCLPRTTVASHLLSRTAQANKEVDWLKNKKGQGSSHGQPSSVTEFENGKKRKNLVWHENTIHLPGLCPSKHSLGKSFSQVYRLSARERSVIGGTTKHRGCEQGRGFEPLSHHRLALWQWGGCLSLWDSATLEMGSLVAPPGGEHVRTRGDHLAPAWHTICPPKWALLLHDRRCVLCGLMLRAPGTRFSPGIAPSVASSPPAPLRSLTRTLMRDASWE